MLGLEFYACRRCDAVHADVERPPYCGRCRFGRLRAVTARLQDASYFVPGEDATHEKS